MVRCYSIALINPFSWRNPLTWFIFADLRIISILRHTHTSLAISNPDLFGFYFKMLIDEEKKRLERKSWWLDLCTHWFQINMLSIIILFYDFTHNITSFFAIYVQNNKWWSACFVFICLLLEYFLVKIINFVFLDRSYQSRHESDKIDPPEIFFMGKTLTFGNFTRPSSIRTLFSSVWLLQTSLQPKNQLLNSQHQKCCVYIFIYPGVFSVQTVFTIGFTSF